MMKTEPLDKMTIYLFLTNKITSIFSLFKRYRGLKEYNLKTPFLYSLLIQVIQNYAF